MQKATFSVAILAACLLFSCASSYITSTWKAPDASPAHYHKIMVFGIIKEADRSIRERMEAHLVGDLRQQGYAAFSAYQVYGPKAFDSLTEAQAYEKLKADSVDAVLTIVLLDKQKERYYNPGHIVYSPYGIYSNQWWSYYHTLQWRVDAPGYYEEATHYFWESNFFGLGDKKLLYSVQTQSFEPASTESLAHQYGKLIVENLLKYNLLSKTDSVSGRPI